MKIKNYLLPVFILFIVATSSSQELKTVIINDTLSVAATLQFHDNFDGGLTKWQAQNEIEGSLVKIKDGKLEITALRGCTVWFTELLKGPLMIEYDAVMIDK